MNEGANHIQEAIPHLATSHVLPFLVSSRTWHNVSVIEPKGYKQARNAVEHQTPREGGAVAEHQLQLSGDINEHHIAKDDGHAIEKIAYAHKPSLIMLREFKHIETIGGNVMGGT